MKRAVVEVNDDLVKGTLVFTTNADSADMSVKGKLVKMDTSEFIDINISRKIETAKCATLEQLGVIVDSIAALAFDLHPDDKTKWALNDLEKAIGTIYSLLDKPSSDL